MSNSEGHAEMARDDDVRKLREVVKALNEKKWKQIVELKALNKEKDKEIAELKGKCDKVEDRIRKYEWVIGEKDKQYAQEKKRSDSQFQKLEREFRAIVLLHEEKDEKFAQAKKGTEALETLGGEVLGFIQHHEEMEKKHIQNHKELEEKYTNAVSAAARHAKEKISLEKEVQHWKDEHESSRKFGRGMYAKADRVIKRLENEVHDERVEYHTYRKHVGELTWKIERDIKDAMIAKAQAEREARDLRRENDGLKQEIHLVTADYENCTHLIEVKEELKYMKREYKKLHRSEQTTRTNYNTCKAERDAAIKKHEASRDSIFHVQDKVIEYAAITDEMLVTLKEAVTGAEMLEQKVADLKADYVSEQQNHLVAINIANNLQDILYAVGYNHDVLLSNLLALKHAYDALSAAHATLQAQHAALQHDAESAQATFTQERKEAEETKKALDGLRRNFERVMPKYQDATAQNKTQATALQNATTRNTIQASHIKDLETKYREQDFEHNALKNEKQQHESHIEKLKSSMEYMSTCWPAELMAAQQDADMWKVKFRDAEKGLGAKIEELDRRFYKAGAERDEATKMLKDGLKEVQKAAEMIDGLKKGEVTLAGDEVVSSGEVEVDGLAEEFEHVSMEDAEKEDSE